jgi:tight adherence protein C
VDVQDLRGVVRALNQTDKAGVPVAKVLRVQSEDMRERRRQRAEERAMAMPVKLIFPLVLFILPALFIVLIGPAALRLMETGLGG